MRRLPLIAIAIATCAHAQKPSSEALTVSMSPELESVGRVNCLAEMDVSRTITVLLGNSESYSTFELRLSHTRDTSEICDRDTVEGCPAVGDDGCRCLDAVEDSGKITWTGSLADAAEEDAADLCKFLDPGDMEADAEDRRQERKLYFYPHYTSTDPELEDDDEVRGTPLIVRVDYRPPDTPKNAPVVISSERALKATFDTVPDSDADIDHYEVCVKELVLAAVDAGVVDDEGFLKCVTADEGDEVKVPNLTNGVTYEVVYRAVDTSGNAGGTSPRAEGVPAEQLDFAEVYRARGGLETGGCAVAGGSASVLGLLLFVGLVVRRRR